MPPTESIMVSAHCDMCPHCRRIIKAETERLAGEALSEHRAGMTYQFDAMLAGITQLPTAEFSGAAGIQISRPANKFIELDGKRFKLPRTLQRFAGKTGNWSGLVGRLWQAPVDIGSYGVAHFIYMGQGGSVPEHTHRGTEFTLVLDGQFSDGLSHYDSGDFILMDGEHTHAPRTDAPEGCLVFSILDQPLHFTSGLARLLNPFSHLFFR